MQDTLDGLKENVIVGRLIPAGTGSVMKRLRRIAADRDKAIAEERAKARHRRWKTSILQLKASLEEAMSGETEA